MPGQYCFIIGRKSRGGRPRSPQPLEAVSTRLPAHELDSVIRLASQRGVSVTAMVRDLVRTGMRSRSD